MKYINQLRKIQVSDQIIKILDQAIAASPQTASLRIYKMNFLMSLGLSVEAQRELESCEVEISSYCEQWYQDFVKEN
jgi:hypothetical protein